jgi:UDP-glucuronate 4-epimerase
MTLRFLITGSAGFVGFHLAKRLLADGHFVVGFDGLTPYYDIALKKKRHSILNESGNFSAIIGQLDDIDAMQKAVANNKPDILVHLAAQAGVRYGLENPESYVRSNLIGSFNILELARQTSPKHLLLASTSSIYGGNEKMPFAETDRADSPASFYAATKKSMEAMSHAYSHLWQIPTTCFRFFTVYGPWGRPDMALFKFVNAIERGEVIDVYGEGRMKRDFTYIDDLVEAISRLINVAPIAGAPVMFEGGEDSLSPIAPWRTVNIAGAQPIGLMRFIESVEKSLKKVAKKKMLPMQKGDVFHTFADAKLLRALTGFTPSTDIDAGVSEFVRWYRTEFAVSS